MGRKDDRTFPKCNINLPRYYKHFTSSSLLPSDLYKYYQRNVKREEKALLSDILA